VNFVPFVVKDDPYVFEEKNPPLEAVRQLPFPLPWREGIKGRGREF